MPQKKVICIGSMGKDIFFPLSLHKDHDEAQGDVPDHFSFSFGSKIHVEDRFSAPGGCASNVSVGLARLNVDVAISGFVGGDADGEWIVKELQADGVNTKNVISMRNAKTDLSVVLVDDRVGERVILVNRDVGEQYTLSEKVLRNHDWCFVGSLYGSAVSDNMRTLHHVLLKQNINLAYNPGGKNICDDGQIVLDLVHHARVVFVNKDEASQIIDLLDFPLEEQSVYDEKKIISLIRSHMIHKNAIIVLTDGRKGAWVGDGVHVLHTDTIDKHTKDTTGAGDAFASGFLAGLLYDHDLTSCVQWGSANSDAVIDHYGAQEGLLGYDIIEERLKDFPVKQIK